ncbi:TPA: hypothetical protein HA297_06475 [Candidatus Woesearchaeota archaeon]|nr:hypothetical protein [Candidatus Woesearchaeota archaeon]
MKSVIKKAMRAFAMQNAVKFGGKATPDAVLGKIFGQYPDEKKNAQEIQKEIQQTIQEVNTMTLAQQEAELIALTEELPELLDVKERDQKQLKPLENAEQGKVVMRFEPSPSGPLHVGHAYALMLNYLYCKKYNGKIILRIADTNPDNIDKNAYQMIEQDFKWLCSDLKYGCYVQSDRMEMYYEWALKLLEEGYAYACTCEQEEFRTKAQQMVDCPCRKLGKEERLKRWHRMLITPEEGKPGEEFELRLELKMIADIGFVGLPNLGKSSLLNELTNANVKVANYQFTTLEPNLGVYYGLILADIPGLIEGASDGKGLGIKFLKHVERTKIMFHFLAADSEDIIADYKTIRAELEAFNPTLLEKPEYILVSRSDTVDEKQLKKILTKAKKINKNAAPISIHNWDQIQKIKEILNKMDEEKQSGN